MGHLSQLQLTNFRNYTSLDLTLSSGLHVFVGENGQGKTNILEAIHFLSLLRSFRTSNLRELAQWQTSCFEISGAITFGEHAFLNTSLKVRGAGEKKLWRDNNPVNRTSDFINVLQTVALIPEDLGIVKGGPHLRRRFLDIVISQCYDTYLRLLIAYRSILRKRNAVLQQYSYYGKSVLKGFDEQLITNGAQVMRMRNETLAHLNGVISTFYESSDKEVSIDVVYQPDILKRDDEFSVDQLHDVFQERLSERLSSDIERGITQSGPHRDNYDLRLNGRSLCKYGSEGQCRFMALALRFAAYELLVCHARDNCAIVFLIDDVLGELDDNTRAAVLQKVLKQQQTVIACTRIPIEIEQNATAIYQIESGMVSQL